MAAPTFSNSSEGSVTGGVVVVSDSFVTIESARPACRDRGVPLVPVPTIRAAIDALERAAAAVVVADAATFHAATPKETAGFLDAAAGSSLVVVYPTAQALLRLPPGVTERSVLTMPRTEVVGLLPLKLRELFGEDLRTPDDEQTSVSARPVFASVPDFDEIMHKVEDGEVFEGPPAPDEEDAEDFMEEAPATREVAYLDPSSLTAEGAPPSSTGSVSESEVRAPVAPTSRSPLVSLEQSGPVGRAQPPVPLPAKSVADRPVPLPSPPAAPSSAPPASAAPASEQAAPTADHAVPLPSPPAPPSPAALPPDEKVALPSKSVADGPVPLPPKNDPGPAALPPDEKVALPSKSVADGPVPLPAKAADDPPPTEDYELLDSDSFVFDEVDDDDDGPPTDTDGPVPLPDPDLHIDIMPAVSVSTTSDTARTAPAHEDRGALPAPGRAGPSDTERMPPAPSRLDPADRPPDPAALTIERGTRNWEERTEVTGIFNRELTQVVWNTQEPRNAIPTVVEKNEYEIERLIGKGKNASVYLARWPGEVDYVALKVLDPALAAQEKFKLRFRREIRAQAVLNHPNIVRVRRFGRRRGSYYVAFELVKGNLADVLADLGPVPSPIVCLVLDRILAALDVAHRRGVFHRALKPSNLMVTHQGEVKLGDFSVAKSTIDPYESVHGARLGAAEYFSPEQAMGEKIGPKTDLFSLATVAMELLIGENPFDKKTFGDAVLAVSGNPAPFAPSLSARAPLWLSCFVRHLHMREVGMRPESAHAARMLLAPLTNAVQAKYPDLLPRFFAAPRAIKAQLDRDEAETLAALGLKLAHGSPAGYRRAALVLRRVRALDRTNTEVAQVYDELKSGCGFRFLKPDLKAGRGTPADIEHALEDGRLLDYAHGLLVKGLSSPYEDRARQDLIDLIGPPDQALR